MDTIPGRSNEQGPRAQVPGHPTATRVVRRPRPRKLIIFMSLFGVVVLAALVSFGLAYAKEHSGVAIDKSKYQAVFLSNGQVYFGKLQNSSGDYLKLTHVFYLQTKTASTSENPQTATSDSNNVELIKLGSEIHGPEDAMSISHDQVLFFENLKPDGKVSQSIASYKAN